MYFSGGSNTYIELYLLLQACALHCKNIDAEVAQELASEIGKLDSLSAVQRAKIAVAFGNRVLGNKGAKFENDFIDSD